MKYYMGIDPGASGGIAVLHEDGTLREVTGMPDTPQDIYQMIDRYRPYSIGETSQTSIACIERVHGMPGMGGASMFTFGQNYGMLLMSLLCAGISFEDHTPQKWMKYYQMKRGKTESKTEWKNQLKAKAQQIFPQAKVTLKISDALLIAHYWYKISTGI